MNNTLDNYQPDDRVFRRIFMAVLCFIFSVFYAVHRLYQDGQLSSVDWSILCITLFAAIYLSRKALKEQS